MDLDFIITESDKAANLAQPQPAQATVADAAVVEGFEVKERKMAMSLDALISESRQGKGNRGHKGDASMGGAGGGAGPMRRQRGGPSSGGGGPRQPSVQLTVDTRGPSTPRLLPCATRSDARLRHALCSSSSAPRVHLCSRHPLAACADHR